MDRVPLTFFRRELNKYIAECPWDKQPAVRVYNSRGDSTGGVVMSIDQDCVVIRDSCSREIIPLSIIEDFKIYHSDKPENYHGS